MSSFVSTLRRLRLFILLGSLALGAGALALLPRLQVETDFMNFLPAGDPDLAFFKETGELFGGNYIGMVAVQADDLFTTEALRSLQKLSDALAAIEGVDSVLSLANIMDIRAVDDGIEVVELLPADAVPEDPAGLAALRARVLGNEMYTSTFVSASGTTAAVIIRLRGDADEEAVARATYVATEASWPHGQAYYAGFPIVMEYLFSALFRDMKVLTALVALTILLVLFISFRLLRGVLLPLLTVSLATLGAFAAMAITGAPMTMISAILPVVLFSTGTAYTIHLLNAVHQEYARGGDSWDVIGRAIDKVGVAIVLSGLTTMFGFLALTSSPLLLFRDFGIYTAVGVVVALLISLSVVPVLIGYLKRRAPRADLEHQHPLSDRLLGALAERVHDHPGKILLVATLSALAGGAGMLQLRGDMDVFNFIGADSQPRRAQDFIVKEFGGTTPLSVHVAADLKEPLVLAEMLRVQKRLRLLESVSDPTSIADVIAEMNLKLNGRRTIPPTRRGVASLWLLLEGNATLKQLVTASEDRAMIQGRLEEGDNLNRNKLVAAIDGILAEQGRRALTTLAWAELEDGPRDQLRQQAADEILSTLRLDLNHRQLKLGDPQLLREALVQHLGQPLAPPDPARRRQLSQTYLGSDDSDLELDDPAQIAALVAALAAVEQLTDPALAAALTRALPALAAEDPEGIELASQALHRRWFDAAANRELDALLATLRGLVQPAGQTWVASLVDELRADLGQSLDPTWTVTPERHAELRGQPPAADSVVALELRQTGLPVMQKRLDQQLVRSQVLSLGVALITVLLLLMLQLRSLTGALISIVPIVFALLVNFGTMGLLGITVNPGTMMIAALAIGIGIDYTIHIVTRLRAELRVDGNALAALTKTLQTTGRAVVINVAAVALGFMVLAASQLVIVRQFGLLVAFSMVFCAFGAMTLIPALVLVINPRFMLRSASPRGRRTLAGIKAPPLPSHPDGHKGTGPDGIHPASTPAQGETSPENRSRHGG